MLKRSYWRSLPVHENAFNIPSVERINISKYSRLLQSGDYAYMSGWLHNLDSHSNLCLFLFRGLKQQNYV